VPSFRALSNGATNREQGFVELNSKVSVRDDETQGRIRSKWKAKLPSGPPTVTQDDCKDYDSAEKPVNLIRHPR
jgi:hypothetical protein